MSWLRKIGLWEGSSYLLLLLVAMPIKYLLGEPLPVKIVGAAHGFLFLAYVGAAVYAARMNQWSIALLCKIFLASVLPFGPFVMDRSLRALPTDKEL